MNRKITIIMIFISLMSLFCSVMQITEDNVNNELLLTADTIKKDKNSIYTLDEKTIGNRGYFYIIRNDGTISYHPKKALINFDFSRYPFVQKILKERNGCLSLNADGTHKYVFFAEIDKDEILCLSLDANDFSGTVYKCDSDIEDKK